MERYRYFMIKRLLIIDTYPNKRNLANINDYLQNSQSMNEQQIVFLMDYGVFYLLDEFWTGIFKKDILFYTNAYDAEKYSLPFIEDVIFSGMPALHQLIQTTKHVDHFKEEAIFPFPLLTDKI